MLASHACLAASGGVFALLMASGAAAQLLPGGDFYLTVRSGVSFPGNQKSTGAVKLIEDFDSGWHIGGAVGFAFKPAPYGRWRAELETTRYNDDVNAIFIDGENVPFMGGSKINTIMANLYLDFTRISSVVTPFVGAGLGGVQVYPELHYPPVALYDMDIAFGFQLIGGVSIALSQHWSLDADVRYLNVPDTELERTLPGEVQILKSDYDTVAVVGGVRFTF
jgi:opacity protein-like surface antigen